MDLIGERDLAGGEGGRRGGGRREEGGEGEIISMLSLRKGNGGNLTLLICNSSSLNEQHKQILTSKVTSSRSNA